MTERPSKFSDLTPFQVSVLLAIPDKGIEFTALKKKLGIGGQTLGAGLGRLSYKGLVKYIWGGRNKLWMKAGDLYKCPVCKREL